MLAVILALAFEPRAGAQTTPPLIEWQAGYGSSGYDGVRAVVETAAGDHMWGGYYSFSNSISGADVDFWLMRRFAANGGLQEEFYNMLNNEDMASIVKTSDGFLLGGYVWKTFSSSASTQGGADYWIAKVDDALNQQWSMNYGGNTNDYLTCALSISNGYFLLGGYSGSGKSGSKTSTNYGADDFWLVKVAPSSAKVWDVSFGGSGYDQMSAMVAAPDGGYLLGGSSDSGPSGNKGTTNFGSYDYWIIKIDDAGNKQWETNYGGTGYDQLGAIVKTSDGYLLAGNSDSRNTGNKTSARIGSDDYWIIKIDFNGNKVWEKVYGGTGYDDLRTATLTSGGGFLLVGESASGISGNKTSASFGGYDYWIVQTDASGNKQWEQSFGGTADDKPSSVSATLDNGFLIGGTSYSGISGNKSMINFGASDAWVLKLTFTPFITNQPQNQAGIIGATATFTVGASGLPTLQYQWEKDGVIIPDQTGSSLVLSNLDYSGAGWYRVAVSNDYGGLLSSNALLKVLLPAPPIRWQRDLGGTNGDTFRSIVPLADGGLLLAGDTSSGITGTRTGTNFGGTDYWIVKLDSRGNQEWDKNYGGSTNETLSALLQTADGGFLLGGYSTSPVSGNKSGTNFGGNDYWIIKTDRDGTKLWERVFGGTNSDRLQSAVQTADGGFFLGGYSASGASGNKTNVNFGDIDYWTIKLDAAGNKEWEANLGGTYSDLLRVVLQTADGGYLLAGDSGSGVSGNKTNASIGSSDFWIVKLNATGGKLWERTFGGTNSETFRCMIPTRDGNYLLGGHSSSPPSGNKQSPNYGGLDYWLVKMDANGGKLWDLSFGGADNENLEWLAEASTGEILVGGLSISGISGNKTSVTRTNGDYWIINLDENGNERWEETFGGTGIDRCQAVAFGPDGSWFVAGYSTSGATGNKTSPLFAGNTDGWVLKLGGGLFFDKSIVSSNGIFLQWIGEPGESNFIESSTNLLQWSSVDAQFNTNGAGEFFHPVANQGQRFYRLRRETQ
jgi:hypothetical protein